MRVLAACSLGGTGHLIPLLPFLDAASQNGDEVLVAIPPSMQPAVAGTGHRYEVCAEPPESAVAPIRESLPRSSAEDSAVLANRDLFGDLCTTAMLPRMAELFEEWRPDLVLREPCEYASAVLALRRGTPSAQIAISLAGVEASSITLASSAIEPQEAGITEYLRASPYLTRFPESLDPPQFEATIRYREEQAAHGPGTWTTTTLPADDVPFVYVSFGTVLGHMEMASEVFETMIEAASGLEAQVLLTVGSVTDISSLGPIPKNVLVEPWVAQETVLERASVVVCHGGSGTVLGSLALGVPLVLVPLFADQFENSRRVADAGAGVVVPLQQGWVDDAEARGQAALAVRRAVDKVLEDETFSEAAVTISAEIRGAPTPPETLAAIVTRR